MNCFTQIKICFYLVLASLNFKDYIECTLNISKVTFQDLRSVCINALSKQLMTFLYSWRDLTPLLHIHLEITKKNLIILDAIKASVPKFLNFLGAKLSNKWLTHLEGKTLLLAENTDRNQISKKFIQLPKIRFRIIDWIMQKKIFLPRRKY